MNKEIIDKTIAALRHNHFEAFFAHNTAEASAIFFRDIFPGLQVETVSWGDSETMKATGVLNCKKIRNSRSSIVSLRV